MSLRSTKNLFLGLTTVLIFMSGWGANSNSHAARVIELSRTSTPGVTRLFSRSGRAPSAKSTRVIRLMAPGHRRIPGRERLHKPFDDTPTHRVSTSYLMRPGELEPPLLCSFNWRVVGGLAYRGSDCKRGFRSKFPSRRHWSFQQFRKTSPFNQAQAWQGRIRTHKLYQGDLKKTDHMRQMRGDPDLYLDKSRRYRQSARFGRKIYYPRALWGD